MMIRAIRCFAALLLFSVLSARAEAPRLLYTVDFESPEVKRAVERCLFARMEKDLEGTPVLTVTVPQEHIDPRNPVSVSIPVDMKKIGAAGIQFFGEGEMKYSNVSKPANSWNGAKFMLIFESGGETHYPSFNTGRGFNSGTRGWYRTQAAVPVPTDVKQARLILGLQDSSGTVSYRNIRFFQGHEMRSVLKQNPIPQAKYTGRVKNMPVARGVMSPNEFREEDFAELKRWNANLIRWQLNRPLQNDYTLDMYKAYTAKKLEELPRVLDAGAKYGIKILIDLHPFEGGKLVLSTPEGREYLFRVWDEIVKLTRGHSALWGYDILNEPHSDHLRPDDPSWPEIAAKLVRQIRTADPETPIIVESDNKAHCELLEYLPVFDEVNIIYSMHFYLPGHLTHQLNPKGPHLAYPDETRTWNKEQLRKYLQKTVEFQRKTGARIYVGEFSCIRWAPGADQYIKDCIDLFEGYGWDWSYHAFREWSGWSVEHSDDPAIETPVPMTTRKRILLDAFRKNRSLFSE